MALQRWPLAKYSHWSTADEAWIEHPAKDMCIQITQVIEQGPRKRFALGNQRSTGCSALEFLT